MLKHLQRRFAAISMFALTLLVVCQLTSVNLIHLYQSDSDVKEILDFIVENDGTLDNISPIASRVAGLFPFSDFDTSVETPDSTRYFVVKVENNVVVDISTENINAVTDKMAIEYASQVSQDGVGYGYVDVYRYLYVEEDGKAMMVFIDFSDELIEAITLAIISSIVGIICIIVILFPVYWLSKRALAPVFKSMEKQKQFITDAGHELKTPVAIISADADVLKLCGGDSEWVDSIKKQTERMDKLIKNLVDLSKLDEAEQHRSNEYFNISDAVFDAASNFETLAASKHLEFIIDVSQDMRYKGNEAEIRQLVGILCDNAIKYCNDEGVIKLSLYKSGRSICLDVYNTCDYIDPKVTGRLFDRFYRADNSRARETGGYGIGLSIAKAVTERHKGRIRAISNDSKSIVFKVNL
ncbi:MAG: HAMP domain-containing sensor histidine kinase [Clostridia bacterium]